MNFLFFHDSSESWKLSNSSKCVLNWISKKHYWSALESTKWNRLIFHSTYTLATKSPPSMKSSFQFKKQLCLSTTSSLARLDDAMLRFITRSSFNFPKLSSLPCSFERQHWISLSKLQHSAFLTTLIDSIHVHRIVRWGATTMMLFCWRQAIEAKSKCCGRLETWENIIFEHQNTCWHQLKQRLLKKESWSCMLGGGGEEAESDSFKEL